MRRFKNSSWYLQPLELELEALVTQNGRTRISEVHRVFPGESKYNRQVSKLYNRSDDDPFVILPANLKNFEKLGADLFFNLLVKISLYSILVTNTQTKYLTTSC